MSDQKSGNVRLIAGLIDGRKGYLIHTRQLVWQRFDHWITNDDANVALGGNQFYYFERRMSRISSTFAL